MPLEKAVSSTPFRGVAYVSQVNEGWMNNADIE